MTLEPPPPLAGQAIALFLDVDGTLIEIAERPGDVHVPLSLLRILERLQTELDGALALVSGRPISQLDDLFGHQAFSAAGLHGFEQRNLTTHDFRHAAPPEGIARARAVLERFVQDHPGMVLEDKGVTLALHYRQAPQLVEEARAFTAKVVDDSKGDLIVLPGKMVFELKPPGVDKGKAVEAFMTEAPFAGRRAVFCGDDVTDEAGFRAVNQAGGLSVRVGHGERPSDAACHVDSVPALRSWLATLLSEPAAA
ncbi:trehalose-phosphatase [Marinivivus vitaminiproducens]|uniref:trehalose-phosphatase n=1 Tax=Marinivivus vitaminiproducens TaxID=3035935 RepID=UPI00279958F5|nr:trehalose-phosphatase [Geminicoccaceae bacterium SCSIO 64248]